jgi:hypothetical protein
MYLASTYLSTSHIIIYDTSIFLSLSNIFMHCRNSFVLLAREVKKIWYNIRPMCGNKSAKNIQAVPEEDSYCKMSRK